MSASPLSRFEEEIVTHPVRYTNRVTFEELLESPVKTVQTAATTFSALNAVRFKFVNTGAVDITTITDGQDGQLISILGDGFTTLKNNSDLILGGDLLLAANKIHLLVCQTNKWYPLPGAAPVAGAGITVSGTTVTNKYVGKVLNFSYGIGYNNTDVSSTYGVASHRNTLQVVDLTGMTQYRISGCAAKVGSNGTIYPILSYSTNGSAWTDVNTYSDAFSITSTNFTNYLGAWRTLPVGARIGTCYVRLDSAQDVQSYLNNLAIEFKP